MKRAKTSLPVPVSPVSKTVASLAATRAQVRLVSTSGLWGPWTKPTAPGPEPAPELIAAAGSAIRGILLTSRSCPGHRPPGRILKGPSRNSGAARRNSDVGSLTDLTLSADERKGPHPRLPMDDI